MAGVILIAVALFTKNHKNSVASVENKDEATIVDMKDSANISDVVSTEEKKSFEGMLYASEDKGRGNLKLTSDNTDIYIRTSRDFSSLIGLSVVVTIEGTLDNFELVDIQPKLEKNGFLLKQ